MQLRLQKQQTDPGTSLRPELKVVALGVLLLLNGHSGVAEETNTISQTLMADIKIHNAPTGDEGQTFVQARMYDIIAVSERPDQQGVVASERAFQMSRFGVSDDTRVILPHAVQTPRERIFADDSDEPDFGMPRDGATWESHANQEWGWLSQDVNQSVRTRNEMRILGENAMRESLMMQSLGLGTPQTGGGMGGLIPGANPLLSQPLGASRDTTRGIRNLTGRELPTSSR